MRNKINFNLNNASRELLDSYPNLEDLIINEYSGEQLFEIIQSDASQICGVTTARQVYEFFCEEINEKVLMREVADWPEKDKDYTQNIERMMVNKYVFNIMEDILAEHGQAIQKNPEKLLCDVMFAREDERQM